MPAPLAHPTTPIPPSPEFQAAANVTPARLAGLLEEAGQDPAGVDPPKPGIA